MIFLIRMVTLSSLFLSFLMFNSFLNRFFTLLFSIWYLGFCNRIQKNEHNHFVSKLQKKYHYHTIPYQNLLLESKCIKIHKSIYLLLRSLEGLPVWAFITYAMHACIIQVRIFTQFKTWPEKAVKNATQVPLDILTLYIKQFQCLISTKWNAKNPNWSVQDIQILKYAASVFHFHLLKYKWCSTKEHYFGK